MTICICGHDIAKHSNQGCMAIIDVSEDKFCPCELTRMDVIRVSLEAAEAALQAVMTRAAQAEAERDEWRDAMQHLTPLGSEYTTPSECAAYIQGKMMRDIPRRIIELEAERDEARRQLEQAVAAEREAILALADELEFKPSKWSDLLAEIRDRK